MLAVKAFQVFHLQQVVFSFHFGPASMVLTGFVVCFAAAGFGLAGVRQRTAQILNGVLDFLDDNPLFEEAVRISVAQLVNGSSVSEHDVGVAEEDVAVSDGESELIS